LVIREENRDLLTVPQGYCLAHCISGDFALGAGIAVQIDRAFNMKSRLKEMYGDCFNKDCAIRIDNVFNLVTKNRCFHKPTYDSLRAALEDMKYQIIEDGITKLAMPYIGCGLDKLEWDIVKEMIEDIFDDVDIEILVCYL